MSIDLPVEVRLRDSKCLAFMNLQLNCWDSKESSSDGGHSTDDKKSLTGQQVM